jgi:lipopolysaccharide transport system ATP-binding protein
MSASPIISVRGLGKRYVLGETLRHDTIRDHLAGLAGGVLRRNRVPGVGRRDEEFWALRDVSFDVQEGEVLGIIGRNGAGKSTLLKVLSRITEPTTGEIRTRGRMASLLEVGTGFHPELTGRENVYLNGAILGMTKREIDRDFDEIVAFSGVERFLDTPVKRYSSGMSVRLAFAVAAHLRPEILVIDEVLAVGDAEFQKKCLGKMQDVAGSGRTVLFVSHSMAAISSLCPRSILLVSGNMASDGPSGEVILSYLASVGQEQTGERGVVIGDDVCQFVSARTLSLGGESVLETDIGMPVRVSMVYRVTKLLEDARLVPNFHFYTASGVCAFVVNCPSIQPGCRPGMYAAECGIPANFLNEGAFSVGLAVTSYLGGTYRVHFDARNMLSFNVRDGKVADEYTYGYAGPIPGVVRPRLAWEVRRLE